ncbi:hypothetical protein P4O66_011123 [Electrophorus voltai]|uniref:ADAM metallopeptidase domain 12 n=1 Tax=Electrophorus voltai TaxID=2609070 RepID=A0AAD8Z7D3_9TELE|nr:hypothetical protein P4O66_011123 [Electrophorus voltai]
MSTRQSSKFAVRTCFLILAMLAVCFGHNPSNEANLPSELGLSRKYESTEPWLLIGGQKAPISILQTMAGSPPISSSRGGAPEGLPSSERGPSTTGFRADIWKALKAFHVSALYSPDLLWYTDPHIWPTVCLKGLLGHPWWRPTLIEVRGLYAVVDVPGHRSQETQEGKHQFLTGGLGLSMMLTFFTPGLPTPDLGCVAFTGLNTSARLWFSWGMVRSPSTAKLSIEGHPASLKLLIETEGEQLLLLLQKNEKNSRRADAKGNVGRADAKENFGRADAKGNFSRDQAKGNGCRDEAKGNVCRAEAKGNIGRAEAKGNVGRAEAKGDFGRSDVEGNVGRADVKGNCLNQQQFWKHKQSFLSYASVHCGRALFASQYTETHYLEGRRVVNTSPKATTNCYYHGEVSGDQHSGVILSTCTGLRGLITFKDKVLILEPAQESNSTLHYISRGEHLNLTQGMCGHGHYISHAAPVSDSLGTMFTSQGARHKRHAQSNTKYVELIIVADNREVKNKAMPCTSLFFTEDVRTQKCRYHKYQKQGKDVEKVKQRLAEIANYVDKFYRALNIRVALVGLEVWSDSDKCIITQDPFTTLHEFLDWRKLKLLPQKPHDNAQLISGVYFQGTTIGMAPIMSMCTAEQSGGIVMDHSDNPLGAAVTLAHELGHNFGMNHDTPERGCGCRVTADRGGCIMTPSTGYPFPTVFSSCSKKDLQVSLEKGVGMCLFNMPEVKVLYGGQKCGNGYVEEGEECDCGDLEECMNPCCNASTCTLKESAVCAHGQCCEDCQLKPAGTPCRESSNSCDLPEFCTGSDPHCPANVYLHDGHVCHSVDGHCYNGICQTHEQQCITLWGQGAKPAPGICFERVNSAGDPYGNCGKDSKGSFVKCEARDAKCGKIQCQGGANRPVIGTNAVSIETNIPLQEGGRILCRGTHVYLGDDMPDPGLVLTGTKCGENMMCLNRQCQNISAFGVYECSAKCSRRGVCNNKKNCHCEAHWAPPFCDKAGFGGSVDSGPVRLAESESVKVGIVVAFLCLLCVGMVVCIKKKTLAGLFVSNKKNTVEKLRPVGPDKMTTISTSHIQPGHRASPPSSAHAMPQSASIYKSASPHPSAPGSHSLQQLPQCPTLTISQPVVLPFTLTPSPSALPLHRTPLPPLTHSHTISPSHRDPPAPCVRSHMYTHSRAHAPSQGAALQTLSGQNTCRVAMEFEKPSPPQKPLPAVPLGRNLRMMRSPTAIRLPAPIPTITTPRSATPLPQPSRPPPKQPPILPKPQFLTGTMKLST